MTWDEAFAQAQKVEEAMKDNPDEDGGSVDGASMHGCALFCGRYQNARPPDAVTWSGGGGIVFHWQGAEWGVSAEVECAHHVCWMKSDVPGSTEVWVSFIDGIIDDRAKQITR